MTTTADIMSQRYHRGGVYQTRNPAHGRFDAAHAALGLANLGEIKDRDEVAAQARASSAAPLIQLCSSRHAPRDAIRAGRFPGNQWSQPMNEAVMIVELNRLRRVNSQLVKESRYWRDLAMADEFSGSREDMIAGAPPVEPVYLAEMPLEKGDARGAHKIFSDLEALVREKLAHNAYDDALVDQLFDARDAVLLAEANAEADYAAKVDAELHRLDIMIGGPGGHPLIAALRAYLALVIGGTVGEVVH